MRVIDFFDRGSQLFPENLVFSDETGAITYQDALRTTYRIAATLESAGFGKGSHIGLLAPNSNVAFLWLLAVFRIGGIWLPINPRNRGSVNAALLHRFDAELLLYHSSFNVEAQFVDQQVNSIRKTICINEHLMEAEAVSSTASLEWVDDDLAAIFPTSGTTGAPKGVMVTHRNIETLFANFYAHFNYDNGSRHLLVAPMTHSAGILGCLHFSHGGLNIIHAQPDPERILRSIEIDRITHLFVPPNVLYKMLAHPEVKSYRYSTLQHLYVGTAPSDPEKLTEAIGVFGPVMSECFGQTECPTIITAKAPWDYISPKGKLNGARLMSTGQPAIFNQVRIMNDSGEFLRAGEAGEVVMRGNLVTPGYYKDESATAEIRQFGWHHTGDIGIADDDGYLTIIDRKRDLIISGGFTIYPNEIELIINRCSEVQECAVIGIPDEKWGEAVKAIVLLKPNAEVDTRDLIELVKTKLGSVKTPKSVDFVDDLPRNPDGKVMKTVLREQYRKSQPRAVH